MKRFFCIIVALIVAASAVFIGCTYKKDGKDPAENRKIPMKSVSSEFYTSDEIEAARQTVIEIFKKKFTGCTLNSLSYAGDTRCYNASKYYLDFVDADELILLTSDFKTGETTPDNSIEPNSSYEDWIWVLVRKKGETWRHLTYGYGF